MEEKKSYESPTFDYGKLCDAKWDILLASAIDTDDDLGVNGYDFDNGTWW